MQAVYDCIVEAKDRGQIMNVKSTKHDRKAGNTTISISLSREDAGILTRAAEIDGRNRSEFLRHYGKQLAIKIIQESRVNTLSQKRVTFE